MSMIELEQCKNRIMELEEFIKIAGHDLREPLRTVKSLCHILKDDLGPNVNHAVNDDLKYIESAIARMEDLVDHIYLYYKQSNDKISKVLVDPEEILSEVMNDLDLKINEKAAIIEWDFNKEIHVDPKQFKQLLSNLVSNGIKFCTTQPHLEINQSQKDGYDIISVKDNGIGLEEEAFEKIFKPFYRNVGKDEFEGTGLGLSISRKILDNHGGFITVSSKQGKGTTFFVKLPVN